MLDPPGASRQGSAEHDGPGDQSPVGADHAVVAQLLPQQPGEDLLVVAEPDFLDLLAVQLQPDRHAVVGHQRRGADGDGPPERHQVVLEPTAGIDLLPAVRKVGVLAVELRTTAGEVLGHRGDRGRAETPVELKALDVRRRDLGDKATVVAERVKLPSPARLGAQIDLGMQGGADPDGHVLLPGDVGELPDPLGVLQRRQTQRFRPGRHRAGSGTRRRSSR